MTPRSDTEKASNSSTNTEDLPTAANSPTASNSPERDIENAQPLKVFANSSEGPVDPDVVDWNGDDDPEKPINWPAKKKWRNIFVISALTLLTPFASTMFAPAVPDAMRTFDSDSVTLASFVVSVYVLGYAFGPLYFLSFSC